MAAAAELHGLIRGGHLHHDPFCSLTQVLFWEAGSPNVVHPLQDCTAAVGAAREFSPITSMLVESPA
jgi:hypothetical protein